MPTNKNMKKLLKASEAPAIVVLTVSAEGRVQASGIGLVVGCRIC